MKLVAFQAPITKDALKDHRCLDVISAAGVIDRI
jgi:hypothetical protein